jgi:hypothetical protein
LQFLLGNWDANLKMLKADWAATDPKRTDEAAVTDEFFNTQVAMKMWFGVDNTPKAVEFKQPEYLSVVIKPPSFALTEPANPKEQALWATKTFMPKELICGYFGTIIGEATRKEMRYYYLTIRLAY